MIRAFIPNQENVRNLGGKLEVGWCRGEEGVIEEVASHRKRGGGDGKNETN